MRKRVTNVSRFRYLCETCKHFHSIVEVGKGVKFCKYKGRECGNGVKCSKYADAQIYLAL